MNRVVGLDAARDKGDVLDRRGHVVDGREVLVAERAREEVQVEYVSDEPAAPFAVHVLHPRQRRLEVKAVAHAAVRAECAVSRHMEAEPGLVDAPFGGAFFYTKKRRN